MGRGQEKGAHPLHIHILLDKHDLLYSKITVQCFYVNIQVVILEQRCVELQGVCVSVVHRL